MDRSSFAAYAMVLLPLGALASAGCGRGQGPAAVGSRTAEPVVLAELQRVSPGPWRRNADSVAEADAVDPAAGDAGQAIDESVGEAPIGPVEMQPIPTFTADEPADAPPAPDPDDLDAPPADRQPVDIAPEPPLEDAETTSENDAQFSREQPTTPNGDSQLPGEVSQSPGGQSAVVDEARGAPVAPRQPAANAPAVLPEPTDVEERAAGRHSPRPMESSPTEILAAEPVSVERDTPPPAASRVKRSELPWAHVGPRTPEMEAVVQRADLRVRHAFEMAERGALYTARREFIDALQLIAQANDAQQNTDLYTRALTSGLVAIKESADFTRQIAGRPELDLARVVAGHKTPVLKHAVVGRVTPLQAAQRYYNYAQEQLAAAASKETPGSMALFGLAKVTLSLGDKRSVSLERVGQAMTLFQASVLTEPRNFLAANELGVLLAENGNLERARELLSHSARLWPQAITWRNLAAVHMRLGDKEMADGAMAKANELAKAGKTGDQSPVRWVDPETFARMAPVSDRVLPPVQPTSSPQQQVAPAAAAAQPAAETARKGFSDWLPWNTRR